MRRLVIATIGIGLVTGIIGTLAGGDLWLEVGGAIAGLGVCALLALALRKDPIAVAKADAEVEAFGVGYLTYSTNPLPQLTAPAGQNPPGPETQRVGPNPTFQRTAELIR